MADASKSEGTRRALKMAEANDFGQAGEAQFQILSKKIAQGKWEEAQFALDFVYAYCDNLRPILDYLEKKK